MSGADEAFEAKAAGLFHEAGPDLLADLAQLVTEAVILRRMAKTTVLLHRGVQEAIEALHGPDADDQTANRLRELLGMRAAQAAITSAEQLLACVDAVTVAESDLGQLMADALDAYARLDDHPNYPGACVEVAAAMEQWKARCAQFAGAPS